MSVILNQTPVSQLYTFHLFIYCFITSCVYLHSRFCIFIIFVLFLLNPITAAAAAQMPVPTGLKLSFILSVVSHFISFVKACVTGATLWCAACEENTPAPPKHKFVHSIWKAVGSLNLMTGFNVALHNDVSQTKGNKKCLSNIYCFKQRDELWHCRGLRLITMATLFMVALLPWSAGRHHHATLWEDGEGLRDWDWRKLCLQTLVCNALWEPWSPWLVRRAINQRDARDQESSLRCHMCPPSPPVIDWSTLSIDLSCFSVISHLQS